MSEIFKSSIKDAKGPTLIPSVTNGKTTRVKDTSTADNINTFTAGTKYAVKGILESKAAADAKAAEAKGVAERKASEALIGTNDTAPLTESQKVEQNLSDPLSTTPAPIAKGPIADGKAAVDKTVREREQGLGAHKGLLDVQKAINSVKAFAPGYADEIQRYAADKLGYDPEGLFVKLALQKEQQQAEQDASLRNMMIKGQYNPDDPAEIERFYQDGKVAHDQQRRMGELQIQELKAKTLTERAKAGDNNTKKLKEELKGLSSESFYGGLNALTSSYTQTAAKVQELLSTYDSLTAPEEKDALIAHAQQMVQDYKSSHQGALTTLTTNAARGGAYGVQEGKAVAAYRGEMKATTDFLEELASGKNLANKVKRQELGAKMDLYSEFGGAGLQAIQLSNITGGKSEAANALMRGAVIQLHKADLAKWLKANPGKTQADYNSGGFLREAISVATTDHPDPAKVTYTPLSVGVLHTRLTGFDPANASPEDKDVLYGNVMNVVVHAGTDVYTDGNFQNMLSAFQNPAIMEDFMAWKKKNPERANKAEAMAKHGLVVASAALERASAPLMGALASEADAKGMKGSQFFDISDDGNVDVSLGADVHQNLRVGRTRSGALPVSLSSNAISSISKLSKVYNTRGNMEALFAVGHTKAELKARKQFVARSISEGEMATHTMLDGVPLRFNRKGWEDLLQKDDRGNILPEQVIGDWKYHYNPQTWDVVFVGSK